MVFTLQHLTTVVRMQPTAEVAAVILSASRFAWLTPALLAHTIHSALWSSSPIAPLLPMAPTVVGPPELKLPAMKLE